MKTLFKIWLGLTLFSFGIYTPYYVFSNNPIDAVEELSPKEIEPLVGITGQDPERVMNMLRAQNIDLSMSFDDVLDDTEIVSDYEIDYDTSEQSRRIAMANGLSVVKATAELKGGKKIDFYFGVTPKVFLRSIAIVRGVLGVVVSDDKNSYDLLENRQYSNGVFMYALFAEDEHERIGAFNEMIGAFNVRLAQELPESTQEVTATSKPKTLADVLGVDELVSEPVQQPVTIVPQTEASEPQTVVTEPTQEGSTVAGNPSPTQIVIFQYEGKPAYCSDEGIDGPICRGDVSVFIGRGTHKDFMDEGSTTCIAGEQDCQLPEQFDYNDKG